MSAPTVHRRTVSTVEVPLGPGLGTLRISLDGDRLILERRHGGAGGALTSIPGAEPIQLPAAAREPVRDALEALAVAEGDAP